MRFDLEWLGLDWDEETQPQSLRDPAYDAALARLREHGLVYPCFCSRRELAVASAPHGPAEASYPGTCRALTDAERAERIAAGRRPALRVALPEQTLSITDRLCGVISQRLSADVGDIIVRRSDGLYAYQLAVVVDDAADGVTEVVRGDDLLGSAARQVALQQLLGLPQPAYAHVPLVLGDDSERLAKRHGAVAVADLRAAGASAREVVGALAGSAGIGGGGAVAATELIEGFELTRIGRRPWRLAPGTSILSAT